MDEDTILKIEDYADSKLAGHVYEVGLLRTADIENERVIRDYFYRFDRGKDGDDFTDWVALPEEHNKSNKAMSYARAQLKAHIGYVPGAQANRGRTKDGNLSRQRESYLEVVVRDNPGTAEAEAAQAELDEFAGS